MIAVDGILATSFISRMIKLGSPVRSQKYMGRDRHRILDIVAKANAINVAISDPLLPLRNDFDRVAVIPCDLAELNILESIYILTLKPELNTGRPPRSWRHLIDAARRDMKRRGQ